MRSILIVIAGAALLASRAQASLLYSFENPSEIGAPNGWACSDAGLSVTQSTNFPTDGTHSLEIANSNAGGGFHWIQIQPSNAGNAVRDAIINDDLLMVDYTFNSPPSGFANSLLFVQDDFTGGYSQTPGGPDFIQDGLTHTAVFDLTTLPKKPSGADSYFQMGISINSSSPITIDIDNVRTASKAPPPPFATLFSFETPDLNGWAPFDPTTVTLSRVTTNATDGTHALEVSYTAPAPPASGFQWIGGGGLSAGALFAKAIAVSVDVTAIAPIPAWGNTELFINGDTTGFKQTGNGAGSPNFVLDGKPHTITWDVTGLPKPKPSDNYFQIGMSFNGPQGPIKYDIDNFRVLFAGQILSGTVNLQQFGGDVTTVPVTFDVMTGSTVVDTETVNLKAGGTFAVSFNAPAGTYDIRAKGPHWLRQRVASVTLPSSGTSFSLINGDINNDNTVDLGDYNSLVSAFNSFVGDANYNVNADLNGDGTVDLGDYNILVSSFNGFGDD